jgi:hypothetical protein
LDRWDNPQFDSWLARLPNGAAIEVRSALEYLVEHGRGAQLDLVRHRIQISTHFPHMSEVRVRIAKRPHDLVLRVLTCFVRKDTTLIVCVAGDKAAWARATTRDWYQAHVPIADVVVNHYLSSYSNDIRGVE